MSKFVGIKDSKIQIVSDNEFDSQKLKIVELPKNLEKVSTESLMTDYRYVNGKFNFKFEKKQAYELKIIIITNHGQKCGISSYGSFLLENLIPHIADYRILSEYTNENIKYSDRIDESKVIQCWKRGEELSKLVKIVKELNYDLVLINNEYGLFPVGRAWLSLQTQLSNERVITIFHSTYNHKDKTILEAICPEIIVHLESSKYILKEEKKISSKVYVIPHGCHQLETKDKLWNILQTDERIVQFGFLNKYKNIKANIHAVAKLKNKYPKIFFTALCSDTGRDPIGYDRQYNELLDLINSLNVQNHVALVRGFFSDEVLDSYLRTSRIASFIYELEEDNYCNGSSGAALTSMAKNLYTITSSVPHFHTLPTARANNVDELVEQLDKVFSDPEIEIKQLKLQQKYLEENSWQNVAKKYIEIFENPLT